MSEFIKRKFNIKNYSTTVSAERTIMEIEQLLSSFGAEAIIKEYTSDGRVHKLSFKIDNKSFKLPANIKGVKNLLYSYKRNYHGRDSMKARDDKSYNIAWRIIKDWVHSQLSLIFSDQAEPMQVFFPYMYDGKRTLYQAWNEGKLLTQGNKEEKEASDE